MVRAVRRTGLIFGVFGAVLLALGIGLWKLTRDEPEAPIVEAHADKPTETPPVDDTPAPAPVPGKRDGKIVPPPIAAPHISDVHAQAGGGTTVAPELASAPPVDADYLTPTQRQIKILLRRQIDAIDQYVQQCATKAASAGGRLTGMASSKFAIRRGATPGAPNIVDVTESPDYTNVKDAQPFLDCLVATGKHVELDLPEGVVEVTGAQEVDLDGGSITEHKLSAFSVKTPGSP